jgi:hypothetical protein
MDAHRRQILTAAALAALSSCAQSGGAAMSEASTPAIPPGAAGDFNFLAGEWRISHRRLRAPGDWDEFSGEATCWTILGGVGSIEELRIPARDFAGLGLRLLDLNTHVWNDYWVNAKSGALTPPGLPGGFVNGVGIFEADEMDGDRPIKVRGTWDRITPTSCRWRQSVSRDGGANWEDNWLMDWVRAA